MVELYGQYYRPLVVFAERYWRDSIFENYLEQKGDTGKNNHVFTDQTLKNTKLWSVNKLSLSHNTVENYIRALVESYLDMITTLFSGCQKR